MKNSQRALFLLGTLTVGSVYLACVKSNSPLGVYAPNGADVPTSTPTPLTGAIQVYVQDTGVAMQGVTTYLIDPSGNTLGPSITQPTIGMAPFNPPVLKTGSWLAYIPTQSVSFSLNAYSTPVPVQDYYFNSSQPFTVTSSGQHSVSFTTGGNSVAISPVSLTFANPFLTASYLVNGNLNVPVSAVLNINSPVAGITSNATSFVFGEGVTQQAITIAKSACEDAPITMNLNGQFFVGSKSLNASSVIYRNYPITVTMAGSNFSYFDGSGAMAISLNLNGDCGVTWSWNLTDNGNPVTSGTIQSTNWFEYYDTNTSHTMAFTISSPIVGTYTGTFTENSLPGNSPTTQWADFFNLVE